MDIADDVAGDPILGGSSGEQQQSVEDQPQDSDQLVKEPIQNSFSSPPSPTSIQPPKAEEATPKRTSVLVTPAVRHMIKEANVDIEKIEGTGKGGRIMKEDVQRYLSAPTATTTPPSSAPTRVQSSKEDQVVPLTPMETQMFKVMTQSLSIPHFLFTQNVDLGSVNGLRRKINSSTTIVSSGETEKIKLTPLPFIMKAVSQVFSKHKKLNAHLDTTTNASRPQLILKSSHNFGIAVDTPQGLLVPVVRDVQNHSIISLAAEIKRLGDLAHAGKLAPDDFKGATFTVSNVGSIGGSAVSPVIVAPMVGILGLGRAQAVPVYQTGQDGVERIVKQEQMVLSWSADHRILDGATVARAAEAVRSILENVETLGVSLK